MIVRLFLIFVCYISLFSQFSRLDTLRGSITPEREWWDLTYYHLQVKVDPKNKSLDGSTTVQYKVLKPYQTIQIDLQAPLKITKVIQDGKELAFRNEGPAHFITLKKKQKSGSVESLIVYYSGIPKEAKRPPWEGGITWTSDENGKDFIVSTCQGIGASIWWPNKDHMYDEVDSMLISITVPDHLMDVSNGRLRGVTDNKNGTKTWNWFVNNPINNYGVNINIGDYVQWSEKFAGEKGQLDVNYYVLRDHLEMAKKQFQDAPRMLKAFEHWFGPYPFYEDGYKLVEVPYYGMEHQSSVTYGNGFKNGYHGTDVSQTGIGFKFDFIIIHESGHEWFANNITDKDVADMWVHEGFTAYSESLFIEYYWGKEEAQKYIRGTRFNIRNDSPIIGPYNVNRSGSGDMYYKGENILNMVRTIIDNDDKWLAIFRGLNKTFYHQTVTTEQIENFISKEGGKELSKVFDQYLRDNRLPILEYRFFDDKLSLRFSNCNREFAMPLKVKIDGKEQWLDVSTRWSSVSDVTKNSTLSIDPNFYIAKIDLTIHD
ncbi:MAG: M1 family metallopeptidase [Calditrichaeota bacterium]|nr:M1 family metallopeptidase [Calditrichota bacterium]